MPPFADRADAGRRLAPLLTKLADERPILLGLARGGVPVAAALAEVTGWDLDALVVRKVAPKGDREFGVGAVAPGGIEVEIENDVPHAAVEKAEDEMNRRIDAYLDGHPAPEIEGRLTILVDDGLATGVTAIAAARYARALAPARLILAVPVLSESALKAMRGEVDELVYLDLPTPFHAVKDAYETLPEVTDEEVQRALAKPL